MDDSRHSDFVPTNWEVMRQLNGLVEQTYIDSFLESTGDEPLSLRITHSSMYPSSSGSTIFTQPLYSTRFRWAELYEAWKLVIPLQNWRSISVSPLKEQPYTAPTEWMKSRPRLKKNSPTTVRMTCTCAKKFSLDSSEGIPNPNCV